MKTKIRHLYPTPEFIGITSKDGVPLRWLESLVQEARNRILAGAVSDEDKARVMREADSAMVYGAENLRITYTDELTQTEQLQEDLVNATKGLLSLRSLYDENGMLRVGPDGKVPADVLQKLREVVWADYVREGIGSIEGTNANPAEPIKPNTKDDVVPQKDRKTQFLEYFKNAGWVLPGNERELYNDSVNSGKFTLAEAEEWLGVTPGSIENVVKNKLFG